MFIASTFTLGILFSFVFSIVILILQFTSGIDITTAIVLTIGINTLLLFVSPFFTDLINRWFYKVRFLKKTEMDSEFPVLSSFIESISKTHHFPYPKIGIIPDENPTAFTYGSGRYNARIIVTKGLFTYLSENEVKAVVAHELGHVVHRDFVIMMIASTLIQILYELYAKLIRVRGKKSGSVKIIAIISYIFYRVGMYLLLFLSRTREYLADSFAAQNVSAQDLSNALIKIAYGIVSAPDTEASKNLLHSTRHLGIVDVQNAKQIGVISYITNSNPEMIAEAMVFDKVNPWATIIELNSTHPLTGKRIQKLSTISKLQNQPFSYDIDAAIKRLNVNTSKLQTDFIFQLFVYLLPICLAFFSVLSFTFIWIPFAFGLGIIIQLLFKFPQNTGPKTTILDEMRNPYSSPIIGKCISLEGTVIGKGVPGYIFSEDVMYQDKTGLIFLDYNSMFGFIGNFFFALKSVKKIIGVPSQVDAWFFRTMGPFALIKKIKTQNETITSHPILWSVVQGIILMLVSFFFYYRGY